MLSSVYWAVMVFCPLGKALVWYVAMPCVYPVVEFNPPLKDVLPGSWVFPLKKRTLPVGEFPTLAVFTVAVSVTVEPDGAVVGFD